MADFSFHAGDDTTIEITVTDSAGDAVDLTGAAIKFLISSGKQESALITKQTGGSGIVITDAANGVFQVTLSDEDTKALLGIYYFEAEVTESGGDTFTTRVGSFEAKYALSVPA